MRQQLRASLLTACAAAAVIRTRAASVAALPSSPAGCLLRHQGAANSRQWPQQLLLHPAAATAVQPANACVPVPVCSCW
jgi:hypothetical protein